MPELPLPAVPLRDEFVALRGWGPPDVEALASAGTDELIRRFRGSQPSNEAEARDWLADVEPARLRGERLELAIADVATDVVLGSITLWSVSVNHRSASVNYWVRREARGRGVAVRAVCMLASWCFDRLGLARLQLFVDPENIGSQRVAERCGFVREGLLRSHLEIASRRHDSLVYGLLPGEQREHRRSPAALPIWSKASAGRSKWGDASRRRMSDSDYGVSTSPS
jgi:RimJ/RimL family protein N-acetyltransferase